MDELGLRFMDHSDGWSIMDSQPRSGGARPALGTKPHRKDTEREERERERECVCVAGNLTAGKRQWSGDGVRPVTSSKGGSGSVLVSEAFAAFYRATEGGEQLGGEGE
jgi:hypothetical protein